MDTEQMVELARSIIGRECNSFGDEYLLAEALLAEHDARVAADDARVGEYRARVAAERDAEDARRAEAHAVADAEQAERERDEAVRSVEDQRQRIGAWSAQWSSRVATLEAALRDPEALARQFHNTYERLAPLFGYETRQESAVPWDQVPEPNRLLMIEVARHVARAALGDQEAPTDPAACTMSDCRVLGCPTHGMPAADHTERNDER